MVDFSEIKGVFIMEVNKSNREQPYALVLMAEHDCYGFDLVRLEPNSETGEIRAPNDCPILIHDGNFVYGFTTSGALLPGVKNDRDTIPS